MPSVIERGWVPGSSKSSRVLVSGVPAADVVAQQATSIVRRAAAGREPRSGRNLGLENPDSFTSPSNEPVVSRLRTDREDAVVERLASHDSGLRVPAGTVGRRV